MATRSLLIHPVINATDLPTNINIAASKQAYVYEMDGTTLFTKSMYAAATGGSPIANPLVANTSGLVIAYTDVAQSVIVKVDTVPFITSFSPWPQVPFWYEDVRAHGAATTATATVNRAAIQAAVNVVIARGGGTVLLPELYHISGAPIEIDCQGNTLAGVTVQGIGKYTSGLIQDTANQDVLCFGRTGGTPKADIASAYGCGAENLTLKGGAKGLRLNNAIQGNWENIYFLDNNTPLLTEGQCEDHWFEDLDCEWASVQGAYGLHIGADNGLGGANQEIQKTYINKLRIHGLAANATNAIRVDGGLGATGNVFFDGVTLEDGPGNWINCTGQISSVYFRGVTVEESGVHLDNVALRGAIPAGGWRVITQGAGCSFLSISDSPLLAAQDNFGNKYGHIIDQQNGYTRISNCNFIGFPPSNGTTTNGAIYLQDGGALIVGCQVAAASEIKTTTTAAKTGTLGIGIVNGNFAPITNFDDNSLVSYLQSGTGGLFMGQRTFGDAQNTQDRAYHKSIAAAAPEDLGPQSGYFHLFDPTTGKQASFTTNGSAHTINEVSDPDGILVVNATAAVAEVWRVSWNGSNSFILTNLTVPDRIASWQRLDFNS